MAPEIPFKTIPSPSPRGRLTAVVLGALVLVYFGERAIAPPLTSRWLDFPVYWEAGQKALVGQTAYDVTGHFQFKYSPLVALLFGGVFSTSSFESASWIFQKAMLLLWVGLFVRLTKFNLRSLVVALLFFGSAFRLDLELGQVNALVLALMVYLFGLLDRPKSLGADLTFGAIFSLTVQLKLFGLVLVPFLLLRREWGKFFWGLFLLPILSIGGVALVHGISFALSENQSWLASLGQSTDELLLSEQNVSMLGTYVKVFGLTIGKAAWILSGCAYCVFLWRNRSRTVEWFRNWLLLAVAIFNPLVWSYWILYALPLFATRTKDFFGAFRRRNVGDRALFAFTALFLFFAFNAQHARWAWSGGIFLGLLFLAFATTKVRARA